MKLFGVCMRVYVKVSLQISDFGLIPQPSGEWKKKQVDLGSTLGPTLV